MKYTAAKSGPIAGAAVAATLDTKSTAVHIYRTHEGDISLAVRYYLARVRDPMKKLDTVNVVRCTVDDLFKVLLYSLPLKRISQTSKPHSEPPPPRSL